MTKLYTNCPPIKFLLALLVFLPTLLSATEPTNPGNPTDPVKSTNRDSLAAENMLGHLECNIHVDTNCVAHTLTLEAWIDYTFTGVSIPVTVPWSTGQVAHKIIVTPPGYWDWDVTGIGCEAVHQYNFITIDGSFFLGELEIEGPPAICPFEIVELTVNTDGYNEFIDYEWTPAFDDFTPITIDGPGTYSVTVHDAFGCPFTDQFTIPLVPPFVPQITGPQRMCPEGDTAVLVVQGPYSNFMWSNGETGSPLLVEGPGLYEVTATDQYGCTGVGFYGIQSAGVDPFGISITSPTLCPGQLDTLRVLGGFSQYSWSNGVNGLTNIVNQAGTYTVTVTNIWGCTGTASTTVTPLIPPNIATTTTPLCPGGSAMISVTNGPFPQYLWSNNQNGSSITVTSPGTYTVTVSGAGMCTTSTNVPISFAAVPTTVIANPGLLNCATTEIPLDGSASSSGPGFPLNWTTQGGNFVMGQNTLVPTVDAPGTYILTITNQATGCITHDTVVVNQNVIPPGANAGPPNTLNCVNLNFNIGPVPAPSNPDFQPFWTTSNGNIVSGNNTWSPNVDLPGTYVLTVTNSVNQCTSTASVTIAQDIVNPLANILQPSLITCTQSTVTLNSTGSSAGAGFTYLWSTTNGTLVGPVTGPSATAASIGTYTLLVTNTVNGCTSTASVIVDADTNIPVVSAIPPNILTCDVQTVLIDASASSNGPTYTYSWTSPTGTIESGGNSLTPTVSAPGVYTLSLVNTANNCSATLGVTVNEDIAPPLADAGPNTTLNCTVSSLELDGSASATGAGYTYVWTTTDGVIIGDNTILNPTIGEPGTYVLQVTDTNNGCTSTATTLVLEDNNAPQAIIAPPAMLNCLTLQTTINATQSTLGAGYTGIWDGPAIASGGTSATPVVTAPGVYCITITNTANGCTDVECVTVNQDITAPPVDAGNDILINCTTPAGSIGSATNPNGTGFVIAWTTTDGNLIPPTNGPTALIDDAGTYQVVVTNTQNGCTSVDQVVVTEDFALPLADAGQTFELTCVTTSTVLQGTGSTGPIFTYVWSTTDGNILMNGNSLTPTVNADGTYNLLVTNTQNGCTSTDQVLITQSDDVPNAAAGQPQTLTCTLTSTLLSGTGSSTGSEFVYAWSTTNGNIVQNPNSLSPTINEPGTYTITVTNTTNNCSAVASVTINENVVNPVVNAGADNTLTCAITSLPLQAQIVSSSSTNISYAWSTVGGQIVGNPNVSNPTINATGTYLVTVTDAINGCTATDQLVIDEDVTPPTVLLGNPATLTCVLTETPISAAGTSTGAIFTYNWTTANGNFVTTQNPLAPIVDAPGTYNLLVTNTDNGCTETAAVTVPEDVNLPNAEAGQTVGLDCDTPTNTLNGTGSSVGANFTYQWSTTNGQIVQNGTTLNPTIGDPGNYQLVVTNTTNGCTQTDNVTVTEDVNPPVFTIATPAVLTCSVLTVPVTASGTGFGSSPNFTWSTTNGNIVGGGNSLNATVNEPGNYTLTALNTVNGCTSTSSIVVLENVTPPTIQVQPAPLLTCTVVEFPLQSTASAQTTVLWTTTNGHIVSGANTLNPVVDEPGNYNVVVTSTVNGCTSTNAIPVNQETNLPTGVEFDLAQPLCNGTLGVLEVNQVQGGVGPYSYSIDGGETFFTIQEFGNLTPGSYDLVIQDANGCEIDQPINVVPPLQPMVTAPLEFSIQLGENQEIQAIVPAPFPISRVEQVIWSPVEGLTFEGNSILQLLNPTATPFVTTEYTVTIITPEGCQAEARTTIKVDRLVDIYAPNVIMPTDPDGDNGTFQLFGRDESVANIQRLQIFDRWGNMVFENKDFSPNDLSNGWDGSYRGSPVNPAVYVWYAEVALIDGRVLLLKGDVTVVR